MEKRCPGRPTRMAGAVGRQKIVADIRQLLQSNRPTDFSRKSLAMEIGVTPALITYYFPERSELFEAVAVPVIENYRIDLTGIINRTGAKSEKLRDIISTLARLYGRDRRIFEFYREIEQSYPDDFAEIDTMTNLLSDFFSDGNSNASAASFDAAVLQGTVRAMCEFADRVKSRGAGFEQEAGLPTSDCVEQICVLFTRTRPDALRTFGHAS